MARSRSQVLDYAAYLVVRCGVAFMQALTPRAARDLGLLLGWLGFLIDRRHRRVADENLQHAFPDLSARRRSLLVRGCFRHFASLIIDVARLPRLLGPFHWRRHVHLVGGEQVVKAMTSNRPAIIVTAHFGNWELAGFALGAFGFKTFAIARTLDNPYLEEFVRKFRQRTGQRILAKKGDFDRIEELMHGNGVVATLADQDAGPRGLFVDFFGRPASTHKAIALMAIQFNVPLVVATVPKIAANRYEITIVDTIEPSEYADRPDAVRAITQRFTAALERAIRRHPEQYFWLHRRWKHQPRSASLQ